MRGLGGLSGLGLGRGGGGGFKQIANRCYVPMRISGSATIAGSRSAHFARDRIVRPRLAFPNWYVNPVTGSGAEQTSGGDHLIEASIEYPAGTFTRITFSGANQGTILAGATLWSDPVSITIPSGAQFWVRQFRTAQGSGKVIFTSPSSSGTQVYTGECFETGSTNKVMGGTIAAATSSNMYPAAIIAPTNKRAVIVIGDSRGFGEGGDATLQDTGEIAPSVAVGVINACVPSDQVRWQKVNLTRRLELAAYCTDVVCQGGINDVKTALSSLATLKADVAALWGLFPGKRIYQATLAAYTTSTDSFTTLANQTTTALNGTVRNPFNDWLRAGSAELVVNGAFSDGVNNWTNSGLASHSIVAGSPNRLRVTTSGGAANNYQGFATVIGQVYTVKCNITLGTAPNASLNIGTSAGGVQYGQAVGTGAQEVTFRATATTAYVTLAISGSSTAGQYADFDSVTTIPSRPGLLGTFDIADVVENSRNDGKWKVNGTPFWYTVEGLHESQVGYTAERDSGAVLSFA